MRELVIAIVTLAGLFIGTKCYDHWYPENVPSVHQGEKAVPAPYVPRAAAPAASASSSVASDTDAE